LYRINYIKQTIEGLKKERSSIPTKQVKLARDMKKVQSRLLELTSETQRVHAIEDHNSAGIVSSPLLHGARQAFSKADLLQKLEQECV
jgi:hypothetical protein